MIHPPVKTITSGPCEVLDCKEPKHYLHTIPFQFCLSHMEDIEAGKEVLLK